MFRFHTLRITTLRLQQDPDSIMPIIWRITAAVGNHLNKLNNEMMPEARFHKQSNVTSLVVLVGCFRLIRMMSAIMNG
jgi:hypothetical protein